MAKSSENKEIKSKTMLQITMQQFFEHRMAVFGMAVIILFCIVAIGADGISYLVGIDPDEQDILNRFGPWADGHILGTDEIGRDVLMRLIYGTRISLMVAMSVAFLSGGIGIIIGSVAGYFGGILDAILMRVTDSMLALPTIPLLIIFASVDTSKLPLLSTMDSSTASIVKIIAILVLFGWMQQARLIRGEILSIKEQEFVLAAQTSGLGSFKIILRELLPNVMSPVIVSVTLNVGQSILSESALSFLGLGIQPPTPTWGNMLNNAQEIIYTAPWLAVIPGLLILAVVVSFNFLGDGLQEAMDPKAIRR
jgi:peptide/nickel transport system permease protein